MAGAEAEGQACGAYPGRASPERASASSVAKRAPLAARFSGERSGSAWRGTRSSSQPVGMPRGEDLPPPRGLAMPQPPLPRLLDLGWEGTFRVKVGVRPRLELRLRLRLRLGLRLGLGQRIRLGLGLRASAEAPRLGLGGDLGGVIPQHARVGLRQRARVDLAEVRLRDVPAAVGLLAHVRLARCHRSLDAAAILTHLSGRLPAHSSSHPIIGRRRRPLLGPISQRLRAERASRGPAHARAGTDLELFDFAFNRELDTGTRISY